MKDMLEICPVLGIDYAVSDPEDAVEMIKDKAAGLSGEYICFSNVHTTVMACDDEKYKKTLNGAAFVFPDGQPVAKEQVRSGFKEAKRVAGPDFMALMFEKTSDGSLSHFFYGSREETLKKLEVSLRERYPGIKIAGSFSPPFVDEMPEDKLKEDIDRINASGADLIWIGLGAPKQELWMSRAKGRVKGVMLGVGAGFDFHAKTVKRAPLFMQKAGLEWLYRLFQDPGRLFKRYLVTNTRFIWYTKINKRKD